MLAYETAKTLIKTGKCEYNPIVFYGPENSGKSHLLQSIAKGIEKNFPSRCIVYLQGREFYQSYRRAAKEGKYQNFRNVFF